MNQSSSRSHCLFIINMTARKVSQKIAGGWCSGRVEWTKPPMWGKGMPGDAGHNLRNCNVTAQPVAVPCILSLCLLFTWSHDVFVTLP